MGSENNCNNFGIGIFLCNEQVVNTPYSAWWMVISANVTGTAVQTAFQLGTNKIYKRYCSAGNWSEWESMLQVKIAIVQLQYKSSTEMQVDIALSGAPVSLFIAAHDGTPWEAVDYAFATRVGDKIKCNAFGNGFVQGHLLAAMLFYYEY